MALPGPGPSLSMSQIGTEFGDSQPHSLTEFYRGGPLVSNYPPAGGANAGVPTQTAPPAFNTIAIGNFYGANNRNVITVTITASTSNYNAFANRGANYFAGKTDITYVINPGVTISSGSTAAAFTVPSEFSPTDTVTIINRGIVIGRGGNGGAGGQSSTGTFPGPASHLPGGGGSGGSPAITVSRATLIDNSLGNLWGGGGGGGGGGGARANASPRPGRPPGTNPATFSGGGGGGGGRGIGTAGAGGVAPAPGAATNTRTGTAGTAGTLTANGGGGLATATSSGNTCRGGPGGAGGGAGAAGAAGFGSPATVPAPLAPNPFSPAGATTGGGGGAAGNYIVGNPSVTFIGPGVGSRLGGVA